MKKVLSIVVVLSLVLGSFAYSFAAEPADIADSPYEQAVAELVKLEIMNGYPDGTFRPDNTITRAEFSKILITALELDDSAIKIYASGLSDVKTHWAKGYIGFADRLDIVTGYPDKSFRPQNPVNHNEAITMLVRALGYPELEGAWPANYIAKAIELGVIKEAPASGSAAISRGEVAALVYQALSIPIGEEEKDTILARQSAAPEAYKEWQIPYGDRLIYAYGLDGAVTDSTPSILNSPYWEIPDFYNATASDTLTVLTNFKTSQQATGWTCGPTSALMLLEWYGLRGDLNEQDLAYLRQNDEPGATSLKQMVNIFEGLERELGQQWDLYSTYDANLSYNDDGYPCVTYKGETINVFEWIPQMLAKGQPIIVGWNDWGGHYQVIIGYDTMGTEATLDDVLILADPYDTTDHHQDGYIVQSAERLIWDWSAGWDPDFDYGIFLVATPTGSSGKALVKGSGIPADKTNTGRFTDDQVLSLGDGLAADVLALSKVAPYTDNGSYPVWFGADGLSGPASADVYRTGDHPNSPYYKHVDVYNLKATNTRTILPGYKTVQQATEYTCGVTSMTSVLEWFGKRGDLNELDLAAMRDKTDGLPGTTVKEMLNVIAKLPDKWDVTSTYDLVEGDADSGFGMGVKEDGKYIDLGEMIPHYLKQGIPVMVLWHEWGGHYQTVVGYDTMGTEGTCDDVILLMDSYDTTDHNQNGYVVESYERLIYDWGNSYDADCPEYGFVVMKPAK